MSITLKEITERVIPALREIHGEDSDKIKKALTEWLAGRTIEGNDGKPVEIGSIEFVESKTKAEPDLDGKISAAVAKAVAGQRGAPKIPAGDEEAGNFGFKSFSDFAKCVYRSGTGQGLDERLTVKAAATTFANEGAGSDGGYLVPPQFSDRLMELVLGEDSLLGMTFNVPVAGNSLSVPADELPPWATSGIRARLASEGSAITQDKPILKTKELRLHKISALAPVTDELLEDAPALDAYLNRKLGSVIQYKVNDLIINGTGAGQPLGIKNAASTVSVTRDTASAVKVQDILNMRSRLLRGNFASVRWLINPDVFPQLPQMIIGDQPVFVPPTGLADQQLGRLLGIPIMETDTAQSLGTLGDVYLVDFSGYLSITKAGGIKTDVSMHLFFDANQTAFRATLRLDGQPWLSAAVSPANGSNTRSYQVVLN